MSRKVEIDRLVLDGFDLDRGRAERLRGLLEAELQVRLEQGDWQPAPNSTEIDRLAAPAVRHGGVHDDRRLASDVARSVAGALVGPRGRE